MNIRTFSEDVYTLKCNLPGTGLVAATRYPASGSFIDMLGKVHGVFLIGVGVTDTEVTFDVYQDTSATETANIKKVTGAVVVVAADDDEQWVTIEFDAEHLDISHPTLDYRYVTLVPTGAAGGNDFFAVFFMGFGLGRVPVVQPANYSQAIVVAG